MPLQSNFTHLSNREETRAWESPCCCTNQGRKRITRGKPAFNLETLSHCNDIKGDLFTQTAGYRNTLGEVIVIDPQGLGHRFDPLEGKQTEDELHSAATHLLFKPDEGEGAIFTQRAINMLTQLFLAARREGQPPFPY